jgi:YHS domain-containing protein
MMSPILFIPAWLLQSEDIPGDGFNVWGYAAGGLVIVLVAILAAARMSVRRAEQRSLPRPRHSGSWGDPGSQAAPRAVATPAAPAAAASADPMCGRMVSTDQAFPFRAGGDIVYFCSPECRSRYIALKRPRS